MASPKNRKVAIFFVLTQDGLWRVPQSSLFLIIELYCLISKDQKVNFVFFFIKNIKGYAGY